MFCHFMFGYASHPQFNKLYLTWFFLSGYSVYESTALSLKNMP